MILDQGFVLPMDHSVTTIDCTPDNIYIVCGFGCTLRIYELQSFSQYGSDMIGHRDLVRKVKYSPKGDVIASGGNDCLVYIWNSQNQSQIGNVLDSHNNWVTSLSFSPDGLHLASGSVDHSIIIWNLYGKTKQDSQGLSLVNKYQNWIKEIHYSANGHKMISCSFDRGIFLSDLRYMQGKIILLHKGGLVYSVKYINNQVLISSAKDLMKIWLEKNGRLIRKIIKSVYLFALSPDKRLIVCADLVQRSLTLQNLESLEPIGDPITIHNEQIECIEFTRDGKHIITGAQDKTLRITNIDVFFNQKIKQSSEQ